MPSYELTPDAEADLEKIAEYTLREWGEAQQIRYAELLETGFECIAEGTAISRPVLKAFPHLYVSRCEHHYIFYLRSAQDAPPRIIAVLHERMDMIARIRRRLP